MRYYEHCSSCGKAAFTSYEAAEKAAARMPIRGRVYWCAASGAYHVTHLKKVEYQRKRSA